jgi:hypothetical protein
LSLGLNKAKINMAQEHRKTDDEDYVEVLESASRKVKRFSSFLDLTNA